MGTFKCECLRLGFSVPVCLYIQIFPGTCVYQCPIFRLLQCGAETAPQKSVFKWIYSQLPRSMFRNFPLKTALKEDLFWHSL